MIDITSIKKVKQLNSEEDLKDMNLEEIADMLSRMIKKPKLNNVDKQNIYSVIKSIQKYTPLSKEFILYLIATSTRTCREVVSSIGSNQFRHEMRNIWNKVKRIIKSYGTLELTSSYQTFKSNLISGGGLSCSKKSKAFHFLKELE